MMLPSHPFLSSNAEQYCLSRSQATSLVADGVLRRPLRGVLLRSDVPDTIEVRATCASLVLRPHVVLSDHSAAWLHGIDSYDLDDLELPPDLEVVSVEGHDRTQRTGVLGGKRDLLPEEICQVCGVLTTTALRTACDLACLRGRSAALAVLDAFMRHHGITLEDYRRMLPRFAGRRGVKQLRELIEHATPLAESPGESWMRLRIIDAGITTPRPNVDVHVDGYGWVRLDLAFTRLKIAIEYDGEEFHTDPADRDHDEERRAALRDAGWIVIVVRKDDLGGAELEAWLTELRDSLEERHPRPKRRYSRGPWEAPRRTRPSPLR